MIECLVEPDAEQLLATWDGSVAAYRAASEPWTHPEHWRRPALAASWANGWAYLSDGLASPAQVARGGGR